MKNIPNTLTIFRIFLAILVMAVILYADMQSPYIRFLACGMFFVASMTDFLDGFIARRYALQSRFGEVFDPLADKMLVLGAFIALIVVKIANPWAVFLIFSREFFITGLRVVVANSGVSIAANMMGKIKSVAQYWAIGCLIANVLPNFWNQFFLWFAVALTIISGFDYVRKYLKSF
ncbi:CDP-diacylglycerol--glycerol-3-phosphate 3-phosphatidyltransferase [Helicobacter brantae]|uniref:CDP-diacylglycerol--glycerol-3-phosphate 3-phosphatidyltransferase n=1 Tax=Helicobacter brantae TaxID=375927 RepID=A0A3D8IZT5_9HELI|nr:CDP-diacylglycerol--glycerol-3-phosphate 3-phosphatidyltransferase [Helicobacter brantae]RDU70470.1 CDP-diacylglycerol--glycerol-3-phosphate 3-phosphatidyltransferase [Helicobacter brantae]